MEDIKITPLCEMAYKYGTDKCPQLGHVYTPFYYELFKDKIKSIKKVLEMGIGGKRIMKYIPHYVTGASLRMWRDFFPNAQVYGADWKESLMLEDDRIKTFLCNETKEEDIKELINKTGSDIDLFVDDGSHYAGNQLFLCKTLMPLLNKDVIYIIEDVAYTRYLTKALNQYNVEVPWLIGRKLIRKNSNKLMIIRHKHD